MDRTGRLGVASVVMSGVLALSACSSSGPSHLAASAGTRASSPTTAASAALVRQAVVANLGSVLVDASGMTLYHNIRESGGVVVCTASCTSVWPPLAIPAGSPPPAAGAGVPGVLATVTRPDGASQVSYNGMLLYRFVNDHRPGDVNGQGVGSVWFVVPATIAPATAGATTTTAPSSPTTVPTPGGPPATTARVAPPMTAPPATAPPATVPPATTPPATAPPKPPPTSPPPTSPVTMPCAYPPCR